MLTFSQMGNYGRLGNQLYQYAGLVGLATELGTDYKLPQLNSEWHGQKCLLDNFNISCGTLDHSDIQQRVEEPCPSGFYSPSVISTLKESNLNTDLFGFFQNTKYFYGADEEIKKQLTPKDHFMHDAKEYVDSIRRGDEEIVSIHVRRGDNTDGTNEELHLYGENGVFDKSTLFGQYLTEAFNHFSDGNYRFLVFTGGSRSGDDTEDIEWVKKEFNSDQFVVSDSNDPLVDFARIVCCDHNIISHISTFGWWSAFVNKNENKKVIAPRDYHLDGKDREGFFPEEWILI